MDVLTPRLLAADHGPPLPLPQPGSLIAAVERAGLTGRGGAGFPTARKLRAVAASGRPAVVIANAAEGEPASAKDRMLLTHAPGLVLDGLRLAAAAVGATATYLYAPAKLLSMTSLPVNTIVAEDTFVAGQETAAVAAVEGRRALPWDAPRRIVESGVGGAPTLVQNVETLAHLALIARYGPDWFCQEGTADEPGTFLTTVSGSVTRGGVFEIPYGTRLGVLLDLAGVPSPPQAVLVGGFHGAWVPYLPDLELSRAGLQPFGATPGAGVVVVLGAHECGLAATANVVRYLAGQSAGQCGPCVNGLPRLAAALTDLARPDFATPAAAGEAARLAGVVDGRGACRHPDGTARFVRSSLQLFAHEVGLHRAGQCSAGRRS